MVAHMRTITAKVWLRSKFNIIDISANIVDCLNAHAVVYNVIPDRATIHG